MENKHLENAIEDYRSIWCVPCGEFKFECPLCGVTVCIFCENDLCPDCEIPLSVPARL